MSKFSEHTSSRRTWIICGLLVIILLGLLVAQSCVSVSPQIGHRAPDFTLVDLEGNTVRLSDFRGKVVFLNFWATQCLPCLVEMPDMEELYQEYRDEGVVIIGVNVGEPKSIVSYFVEENGYSWTFVIDTTGEVFIGGYEVIGIPSSFFIDRAGIIRAINRGYMNKATMVSKLAEAMR
ncbi:MAG TPA: redoxin domain-containing protein [Dehalococcoidia bacterium]|nr:redoxin domain-containing protein [Dehalococcoidia bacterium]